MPGAMGPLRRTIRELGLALITLGVVVLLFVAYQLLGTNLTEAHNQSTLARQFASALSGHQAGTTTLPTTLPTSLPASATTTTTARSSPTTADAPTLPAGNGTDPTRVAEGGAVEHLVIPRIGVNKIVVEGTGEDDLRKGPGHYSGTAYPGQTGNAAIAGHRTTYGAPFYRLNELGPGDPIYLTDLSGRKWTYVVDQPPAVVSPSDTAVLGPTAVAQLTLTTCNPRFSASSRLIVYAKLRGPAETVTTTTTPATTTAPPSTTAMANPPTTGVVPGGVRAARPGLDRGNSGAWPAALFYGALAVAIWVGTRLAVSRTRRWRRAGALVGGIVAALFPLWFCFENAVLLLPQSI